MQRHCLHFVPKCNPREPLRHAASLEYLEFTEKLAELADVPSLPLMSVQERINITFRWVPGLRWLHLECRDVFQASPGRTPRSIWQESEILVCKASTELKVRAHRLRCPLRRRSLDAQWGSAWALLLST